MSPFRYFLGRLCPHFTGRSSLISPVGSIELGCTTIIGLSIRLVSSRVGLTSLGAGLVSLSSLGSIGLTTSLSNYFKYSLTIVVLNSID